MSWDITIYSIPRQPGEPHANECPRCGSYKSKREKLCGPCKIEQELRDAAKEDK